MEVIATEYLRINFNAETVMTYTNYKGETSTRRIIPRTLFYGVTPHHPEPQWIIYAWDLEKMTERHFALSGINVKER